jgi:molybdopterin/thiamine biosynthesis adenylyltransferase
MAVAAATYLPRGARLGRYEIEDAVGTGALATVYRARDLENDARVALKRPLVPGDDARWEIEARLLAELTHPGLASLVDHFEEPAGIYNIVMRLVEGTDLARLRWDQGTPGLPVRDVLHWVGQVCEALQYLHDQQIMHGDVKPRNLVRGRDRVVLVDLGLATRLGSDTTTARGGTPRFMAPEVFAGDAVSPRSDVFGIAASAWDLITGSPPAYGEDRTLEAIPGATPELERVLRAGLAFKPEERIESAAALADASGAPMDTPLGGSLAVSVERAGLRRPLLEAVVQAAAGVFEAAAASIAVADPTGGHLTYVAAWGAGASDVVGLELARGEGIGGAAAESGKAQIVPRCRTDSRFAAQVASSTGYVPHTMLVLPLRRDGATVGVLSLLDRRDGDPFGPDDVPRAELFAEVAAASLA